MNVPVYWLSFREGIDSRGPWDTGLLERLFGHDFGVDGYEYEHRVASSIEPGPLGVVVLPARHHASAEDVTRLNAEMAKLDAVLLILSGDEEGIFPWREVDHGRIRFWVMMPKPGVHDDMADWAWFFGTGYKPGTEAAFATAPPVAALGAKDVAWSFAGQVTHARRKQAVNAMRRLAKRIPGMLLETDGFTKGMSRIDYLDSLLHSKVAPCPSGPKTVDSMRFYEALEAGCCPLVDGTTPNGEDRWWNLYWHRDRFPVPPVADWDADIGLVQGALDAFPLWNAEWMAWWQTEKTRHARRLRDDLDALSPSDPPEGRPCLTVVITTSPTPMTAEEQFDMISETLHSARKSLPDGLAVDYVVAADGVRPEHKDFEHEYRRFLFMVGWAVNHTWDSAQLYVGRTHRHQAGTVRDALRFVDTPLVLMMEHDTPLVTDEPIDWPPILDMMAYGGFDVLRFHHEAGIHPDHEYLMIDHETRSMIGVPVRRTRQWSQRPHVASTAYYRRILDQEFSRDARAFIEDRMHSVAQERRASNRIGIYCPPGGNIKRSYHLDGRRGAPKLDETQVF